MEMLGHHTNTFEPVCELVIVQADRQRDVARRRRKNQTISGAVADEIALPALLEMGKMSSGLVRIKPVEHDSILPQRIAECRGLLPNVDVEDRRLACQSSASSQRRSLQISRENVVARFARDRQARAPVLHFIYSL